MTRNDRNAANVPVPAWLGWKRNIFYAALAAIVSAVFIFQLTRPHSLLGGILGWELSRIDDASREDSAAAANEVTWANLFAQLQRKMASLPDARPRAGVAQLMYAVDAVSRGKFSAQDAADRLGPAEDAATFNLLARLAYGWVLDQAAMLHSTTTAPTDGAATAANAASTAHAQVRPSPLTRFEALAQVIDAQPPATHVTLHNDAMHAAWREVLQPVIRREDVIASCVRNYRHYDIREHYSALPIFHNTYAALARDLQADGQLAQAETVRQWLDRTYTGLIDAERDYATRLLAAELLTDVRAGNFYTATPNHHRPSRMREAFHAHASRHPADMVDLYKSPMLFTSDHKPYRILAFCIGAAAVTAGFVIALFCRLLAGVLRLRGTNADFPALERSIADNWMLSAAPITLVIGLGWLCGTSHLLTGLTGSTEGYLIKLAAGTTTTALVMIAISARLAHSRMTLSIGITLLLACATLFVVWADPCLSAWPTLRQLDVGIGAVFTISSILMLLIIVATVITTASARVVTAVAVRGWLITATFTLALSLFQALNEDSIMLSTAIHRRDIINARIGHKWKSLVPMGVRYQTSGATVNNQRDLEQPALPSQGDKSGHPPYED